MKSLFRIVLIVIVFLSTLSLGYAGEADAKLTSSPSDEVVMPTPEGGMATLAKQIKYPEAACKAGVTGTVYLSITIGKDGSVTKTEVAKGVNDELDKAAIDAVNSVKWLPGKKADEAVAMSVTIPIAFKLEKKAEDK